MTVGMLLLIIVAVLIMQVSVVALVGLYRRKRQYHELDERKSEAQVISTPQVSTPSVDDLAASDIAWEEFREFSILRREFEDGNRSVCSF